MFGKSRAVCLLLWLLAAPLFNQIEGNNTVSSSKMMCRGCTSCSNGINGQNGLPGRDGRDGAKGEKGVTGRDGSRGVAGSPGPRGEKGKKGVVGSPGSRGAKGEAGQKVSDIVHRNWKQCAWKSLDRRDIGLIKDCVFNKQKDATALRVVFQGNFYVGGCSGCCKRWFITFNGAECSGPVPIDAVNYIRHSNQNNHRHGAIEGYCNNIHKGKIRVSINIGNCGGYGNADGGTGWNSASRLIIEEVPRSQ